MKLNVKITNKFRTVTRGKSCLNFKELNVTAAALH